MMMGRSEFERRIVAIHDQEEGRDVAIELAGVLWEELYLQSSEERHEVSELRYQAGYIKGAWDYGKLDDLYYKMVK